LQAGRAFGAAQGATVTLLDGGAAAAPRTVSGARVAGAELTAGELRVVVGIGHLIHRGDLDDFQQVELGGWVFPLLKS